MVADILHKESEPTLFNLIDAVAVRMAGSAHPLTRRALAGWRVAVVVALVIALSAFFFVASKFVLGRFW